ncbi:T9SS type A sorting domain-containing protein [candidate division KSB1 bacterium]|nr:T9SS type A sorting domain-containing protein [candidate division KSB1 bacterium]
MDHAVKLLHSDRWPGQIFTISVTLLVVFLLPFNLNLYGQTTEGDPLPSVEPEEGTSLSSMASDIGAFPDRTALQKILTLTTLNSPVVDLTFEGFGFDDNPIENINPATGAGVRFIPPDPHGAAGHNLVIAVVNSMIEARNKGGYLMWRDGLRDFFASLTPGAFPFDPKIVYDQYEDRFVVVALELIVGTASVSPTNVSRILLAVSKDGNPENATAAEWHFHAINSKVVIPRPVTPFDHWADYPGFAVDEEAVYITANMFTFVPFGSFGGVRLWIVDKGLAGGFYAGGPASVTVHNPYASAGIATTTMPAHVFGDGGAGAGIGTYLVSYSGLTFGGPGGNEAVQVVRVDNPLTGPTFSQQFVIVGDLENLGGIFGFPALPDAPQPGVDLAGIARTIEVNDRRALNCVWRNNALWMVAEINPNSGPDAGQTTAHWWKLNTSAVPAGPITLDDQGNIGGEDIASGTFTYFPAVVVNRDGHALIGFSASAPTVFAGAFVTGRTASDPAGTVRPSEVVHAGEDFYFRRFGGANNRWGDYSGIAIDPSNDDFAWVFNEFADQRGTILSAFPTQDGRWGTAWGRAKFVGQDANAKATGGLITESIPSSFGLGQNYPNPFNPQTTISYQLPNESHVVIKVFNLQGQVIRTLTDEFKSAGSYTIAWDGRDASGLGAPSGTYFYQIKARDFEQTKSMILLK